MHLISHFIMFVVFCRCLGLCRLKAHDEEVGMPEFFRKVFSIFKCSDKDQKKIGFLSFPSNAQFLDAYGRNLDRILLFYCRFCH